ncbi:MAG: proline--tRNA ligase [Bdellovibrio sp.]|jgi:prolyl-tRNA synthetase
MKWTNTHIFTLKEAPGDAEIPSHKLMVRGGYIKKLAPGLYTYGNLALRAIRKFENIIREELDRRGCTEILMPMVHPQALWEETGRWTEMGAGLLKFKNRNDQWFCLGATHEEAVTDYARHDIRSYRDLPRNLYQIQTKYRDEIRPRFGLMRGREFSMKDAYSFDADQAGALKAYEVMYAAYQAIFDRLGLQYRIVQADAGNIGGSQTHEFQLLADAGEDALLVSDGSDFAANIEVCPAIDPEPHLSHEAEKPLEKFATPGQKTIVNLSKFTGVPERELVKTLFFSTNEGMDPKDTDLKAIAVLLRGSDEVNPVKLKNVLGLTNPPVMLTDEQVQKTSGAWPGSCGPVGLQIPVYMDNGVQGLKNYIVGANEDKFHLKNVNHGRDFTPTKIADLRMAREGDKCPSGKGHLKAYRGIEVGHVFYLGTKYSKMMSANFLDKEGKAQAIEMGCYGIGVTRTVQATIEQSHDADGIIWPQSIAPYHVHICVLDVADEKVMGLSDGLEKELESMRLDVLVDNRDERPGVKFKDADLLGMPVRLVIGKKGLDQNQVEVVNRKTKEVKKVAPDQVIAAIRELLA